MPFICLANANVPNGVLQVTDLWPNESQRNGSIDPPGQTCYVNRPVTDPIGLSGAGPILVAGIRESADLFVLSGLAAYLADRIDPGGSEAATGAVTAVGPLVGDTLRFTGPGGVLTQDFMAVENFATATVTVVEPVAGVAQLTIGGKAFSCVGNKPTLGKFVVGVVNVGDTVTIAGVVFTAAAAPNHATRVFDQSSGVAADIATDLRACIIDATPGTGGAAMITAALDALVAVPTGGTMGTGGAGANVELTPSLNGTWGQAILAESTAGARIVVTPFTAPAGANASANPPEFCSYAQYIGQTAVNRKSAVATSMAAAINSAATIAAMDILNAGPVPTADFGHVVAVAALAVVTLTASQVGNSGRLALATAQVVNLAISGAELTGNAANPALFQFDSLINATAGTNSGVSTSLAAVLNNAATDTALGTTIGGSVVTAVANTAPGVTGLTADTVGSRGAMPISAPVGAARFTIGANSMGKTMVTWTAALLNASAAAIQALVDAGSPCTVAGINAACNGVAGVSGISVGASATSDILSILAGRVYQLPVGGIKDPTGKNWITTAQGSFTTPNTVFDTDLSDGEWRPANRWIKHGKTVVGGDVVNNEIGGIRTIVDSTHFQASLTTGQLARYAGGTVDLFPDAAVRTHISNWTRRTNRQASVANQRIVTVYDDTGAVLV